MKTRSLLLQLGLVAALALPAAAPLAAPPPPHQVGTGWSLGSEEISLQQPDGRRLSLRMRGRYPEHALPAALPLRDGSLLLFAPAPDPRKAQHQILYRIAPRPDGGALVARALEDAPKWRHGNAAVLLPDGRVLVAGGGRDAWLYDPGADRWSRTGEMAVSRMGLALAVLPDGRVFAAGSGSHSPEEGRAGHGAELWEPRSGAWSALPALPLSYRVNAYHAQAPSAAVLPDGSIALGGGMHPHIALLRARGSGFAPQWTIAASLPAARIGGRLIARGAQEVEVAGGVGPTESGSCCRRLEGTQRTGWEGDGSLRRESVGLARRDAAVAHRGELGLVAGGWDSFHLSTGTIQSSALAELVDLRSGQVRQLAPLPRPLLTGQAAWLDEDRVLVKARQHAALYEQSFRGMDGRGLEGEAAGYLAVFSLRAGHWQVQDDPRIARAELAGVVNGEALLTGPDGGAWAVRPDTLALRALPRLARQREGGTQRALADGRIVVAGGQVQSDLISLIDPACDRDDCPDAYTGFGAPLPSRRHEILAPGAPRWLSSAPSRGAGVSAVVRSDGRVVKIGAVELRDPGAAADAPVRRVGLIEESDAEGRSWSTLPRPPELSMENELEQAELLLAEVPGGGPELLVLRRAWGGGRLGTHNDLWVFDEAARQWQEIGRGLSPGQLGGPYELPLRVGGRAVEGRWFQTQKPRLALR